VVATKIVTMKTVGQGHLPVVVVAMELSITGAVQDPGRLLVQNAVLMATTIATVTMEIGAVVQESGVMTRPRAAQDMDVNVVADRIPRPPNVYHRKSMVKLVLDRLHPAVGLSPPEGAQ
jgi:hypothetical protein